MKLKVLVPLLFLFLLRPTDIASAHGTGLPPYLWINGKIVEEHPFYQGYDSIGTLIIAQDLAPEAYLPNTPITIIIDEKIFAEQLAKGADFQQAFRWSVFSGKNFSKQVLGEQFGTDVTYTFPNPASYLVKIETRGPREKEYLPLNTFQIDIIPHAEYKRPDIRAIVSAKTLQLHRENTFSVKPELDPSGKNATFYWDFSDKKLQQGQTVRHRFANDLGFIPVYARVVDGNGLVKDIGFSLFRKQNQIEIAPFEDMQQAPIIINAVDAGGGAHRMLQSPTFLSLALLIGVTGVIVVILFVKLKRHKS